MPLPVTSQYPPPASWEEFESMCADLFARLWNTGTQKHGRQGQPQGGVDVYGRPDGKNYFGVQCKKKDVWPLSKLTTSEVDEEVQKARTWSPGLMKFIIATTAPNDEKVQKHARKLTEKHEKKKHFSVEVMAWSEITRHLASYPDLLRKYGYLPDVEETARLVIERLQGSKGLDAVSVGANLTRSAAQDPGVIDALERDLAARFSKAMRRSFFPETVEADEYGVSQTLPPNRSTRMSRPHFAGRFCLEHRVAPPFAVRSIKPKSYCARHKA